MAMTPLPPAPSRATPTTFAAVADTFVAALPGFVTDANTLQTDVATKQTAAATSATNAATSETNAATSATNAATSLTNATTQATNAANSAASALNAPGTSATSVTSLTVALGTQSLTIQTGKAYVAGQTIVIASSATPTTQMIGVITSYTSGTGALVATITTIAGSGTLASWNVALSGPKGSAATTALNRQTSATSITLTAGSPTLQAITFSAANQNLNLPDATTLSNAYFIVVKNEGANSFVVRDASGAAKCQLAGGAMGAFYAVDNTTAGGAWAVSNQNFDGSAFADLFVNPLTTLNSTANSNMNCAMLSPTSALCVTSLSSVLNAFVVTITGLTLTIGAYTVLTGSITNSFSIAALSSTKALIAYATATNASAVYTVTVSGTTVTLGSTTALPVAFATNTIFDFVPLTSTTALMSYIDNGGATQPYIVVVTSAATTPSFGTAVQVGGGAVNSCVQMRLSLISATAVLVALTGVYTSSTNVLAYVATISGSTVTLGAVAVQAPPNIPANNTLTVIAISATQGVMTWADTAGIYSLPINMSGTSVTSLGTRTTLSTVTNSAPFRAIMINASKILLVYNDGISTNYCAYMTVFFNGSKWIALTLSNFGVSAMAVYAPCGLGPISTGRIFFIQAASYTTGYPTATIFESMS
jgi:hypothetical protein